jgi:hypothetical protein
MSSEDPQGGGRQKGTMSYYLLIYLYLIFNSDARWPEVKSRDMAETKPVS